MSIEEFLAQQAKLQEELNAVNAQIAVVRQNALAEIGRAIDKFNITLPELKSFYAAAPVAPAIVKPEVPADRKTYAYYDKEGKRWYNGYTKTPKWFDLTKADSYLVKGKSHTPAILKLIAKKKA